MSPPLAHFLLLVIVSVSVLLMLVRPFRLPEVYWVGGGALLLLALHLVPLKLAVHAAGEGRDVYFFLVGMMLLSELAREHGVFEWLSSLAVHHARGSCSRLFTLIYLVGTAATIFMSNDATAVVLTPAILASVRKAKVNPMPYLFVCALIANAASFVLPISNPANLVVFHNGMPTLGRWLHSFAVPSLLSIMATYAVLRWIFRKNLRLRLAVAAPQAPLNRDGKMVLFGLAVTILALIVASAAGKDLGLPTCLAAVMTTIVVSIRSRRNPVGLLREISWSTLTLVAGLFILVESVESMGALEVTRSWLISVQRLPSAVAVLVTGFTVGLLNNLVNNLPMGLLAASTLHGLEAKRVIVDSVIIGVDLGPNLSVTGSLATILWLLALRREGIEVNFWAFFEVGMVAMPVALLLALLGASLMHSLS